MDDFVEIKRNIEENIMTNYQKILEEKYDIVETPFQCHACPAEYIVSVTVPAGKSSSVKKINIEKLNTHGK